MAFNISFNQTLTTPIIISDPGSILINVKPLLILIAGIVIFSLFTYKFYRYLAKRDILVKHWNRNYDWQEGPIQRFIKTTLFILEYIILIPIVIFFWFIIMAIFIVFLSDNTPSQILLLSMAIIAAIRITSYYTDDLSKDLAKTIPFTLLGVFIMDIQYFSPEKIFSNIEIMFQAGNSLLFYLLFVVAIEFIMRISLIIRHSIKKKFDPDYVSEEAIYKKELKRISEENKKTEAKRNKKKDAKEEEKEIKKEDRSGKLDIGELEN